MAPPCSNLRSFRSKCTILKKLLVTLLGLFGALGIVPPFPPLVTSLEPRFAQLRVIKNVVHEY